MPRSASSFSWASAPSKRGRGDNQPRRSAGASDLLAVPSEKTRSGARPCSDADRFAVVAELGVVVVLDDEAAAATRPGDQRVPALRRRAPRRSATGVPGSRRTARAPVAVERGDVDAVARRPERGTAADRGRRGMIASSRSRRRGPPARPVDAVGGERAQHEPERPGHSRRRPRRCSAVGRARRGPGAGRRRARRAPGVAERVAVVEGGVRRRCGRPRAIAHAQSSRGRGAGRARRERSRRSCGCAGVGRWLPAAVAGGGATAGCRHAGGRTAVAGRGSPRPAAARSSPGRDRGTRPSSRARSREEGSRSPVASRPLRIASRSCVLQLRNEVAVAVRST